MKPSTYNRASGFSFFSLSGLNILMGRGWNYAWYRDN